MGEFSSPLSDEGRRFRFEKMNETQVSAQQ